MQERREACSGSSRTHCTWIRRPVRSGPLGRTVHKQGTCVSLSHWGLSTEGPESFQPRTGPSERDGAGAGQLARYCSAQAAPTRPVPGDQQGMEERAMVAPGGRTGPSREARLCWAQESPFRSAFFLIPTHTAGALLVEMVATAAVGHVLLARVRALCVDACVPDGARGADTQTLIDICRGKTEMPWLDTEHQRTPTPPLCKATNRCDDRPEPTAASTCPRSRRHTPPETPPPWPVFPPLNLRHLHLPRH